MDNLLTNFKKMLLLVLCLIPIGVIWFSSQRQENLSPLHFLILAPASDYANDVNLHTVPNQQTSTIQIVDSKAYYDIGDVLRVLITLRDSQGRLRIGGDYLRMWMKEPVLKASVSGQIHDFRNGSYQGSILLPWKGRPTVLVSVATPLQIQNIILRGINKFGLSFKQFGKFIKPGGSSVVVDCSNLPSIPGYSDVCNVTSHNYNVIWYCGKPKIPGFTCDQWAMSKTGNMVYNEKETKAIERYQNIPINNLSINVGGITDTIQTNPVPCHKRPKQDTWHERTLGFNYNSTWTYLGCNITLQRSPNSYRSCLQGRHLLFIGDSNVRSFANYVITYLNLTVYTGNPLLHKPNHIYADDKTAKVSLTWTNHGTPFYCSPFYNNSLLIPPWQRLDEIKPGNRSIILLHMWTHFAALPISIVRSRIRRLRLSLESLLVRVPTVTIVIKGPHSKLSNDVNGHDYARIHHERCWREELKGSSDKIIYLKNWDITVAGENVDVHPGPKILTDMIHNFLSHVCGS